MANVTGQKISIRRQRLCKEFFPDADEVTYRYKEDDEKGFWTVPRTLQMISWLTKYLSPRLDPSRVYLELWCRCMGDPPGFVEILDEEECANACGFYGRGRAVRSWRERIDTLERLGFIRVQGKGSRERAYVLLLHPHRVVAQLREKSPQRIPEWWWTLFISRIHEIKAKMPGQPEPEVAEELEEDDDLPF